MTTNGFPVFPAGFSWGAATSSYQIEGAWNADGKGESIWDRFAHTPGRISDGSTGDVACGHYERWPEDIDLMVELGIQAYRFSISWPRILPTGRGEINPAGLQYYSDLVDGLRAAGIEPFVTLYHWELPQALEDEGGWLNRATVDAFAEFTGVVADYLGDRVTNWATINEPWVAADHGYGRGSHAPGRTGSALPVGHHLLVAHGRAVQVIRDRCPDARVGIVLNLAPQIPASDHPDDAIVARLGDGVLNRWYLDPLTGRGYPEDVRAHFDLDLAFVHPGDLATIAQPLDFLGVNYYFPNRVAAIRDPGSGHLSWSQVPVGPRTDAGWEIYPPGLTEILERVHEEYAFSSYYVTECGAAYEDEVTGSGEVLDRQRTTFLAGHIAAAHDAITAGVPLDGFFVWSLLDNFEWGAGLSTRFGIIHVDFDTLVRRTKASGRWYAGVIADHGISNRPSEPVDGGEING